MIDRGRLEVGDEGSEEQHICMQSMNDGGGGGGVEEGNDDSLWKVAPRG